MRPAATAGADLLARAAAAPSLAAYVDKMAFMHPAYAELRGRSRASDEDAQRREALVRLNLERARILPAGGRYILVNTAAQRLYMYENGRVVDPMRVVVGKPENPTPMMAAYIRFAALNPYWYVPPDLAAERIAPNVVKRGPGLPRAARLCGAVRLEREAAIGRSVDDRLEGGRRRENPDRIRQKPGPHNSMGRMKFMFPNPQGVYLHDTPNKELLNEAARLFSGGCVRLEDAPRLANGCSASRWNPKGAGDRAAGRLPSRCRSISPI